MNEQETQEEAEKEARYELMDVVDKAGATLCECSKHLSQFWFPLEEIKEEIRNVAKTIENAIIDTRTYDKMLEHAHSVATQERIKRK